jgi:hypothetical protein
VCRGGRERRRAGGRREGRREKKGSEMEPKVVKIGRESDIYRKTVLQKFPLPHVGAFLPFPLRASHVIRHCLLPILEPTHPFPTPTRHAPSNPPFSWTGM